MTDEPWRIELTRAAQRDLRRLDPPIRRRVNDALIERASFVVVRALGRRSTTRS